MSTAERRVLELVYSGDITSAEGWDMLRVLHGGHVASEQPDRATGDIAIVGASANYPGSPDIDAFWRMLDEGRSTVAEIPSYRWDAAGLYSPQPGEPGRIMCKWGGFLNDVASFDPAFFNLSGRAAELMDPQQRLFLQGAWRALEDAGAAGSPRMPKRGGVYVGVAESDYLSEEERSGSRAEAMSLLGSDTSILAARISYLLDLRGPNLALNTACSSSLVAVSLGCSSLLSGETDLVLAGGVCLFLGPGFYLSASQGQMLSPTGACHAFDANADGFVPGEGVGVLVLKRLEDALSDGDRIRGVIRATGVNQDGKTNGLTAPSASSQAELERAVYERAGVSADTIGMVEAHGTGTALGDPIEVTAIERAFREDTDREAFCALGSVKTNIGHTAQAAGVAGILKVLLAMEHERIPATLNFHRLNPQIELAGSPFFIAEKAIPWARAQGRPRRGVVSSFGYSGTNAHILLEEPPKAGPVTRPQRTHHLFLVSARTPEALERQIADLRGRISATTLDPYDVAFTLAQGRRHWSHRAAFVARDMPGLADLMAAGGRGAASDGEAPRTLLDAARAYVSEGEIPAIEGGWTGRIVSLPGHPFDMATYWNGPLPGSAPDGRSDSDVSGGERLGAVAPTAVVERPGDSPLREAEEAGPGRRFRIGADHWWVAEHRVAGAPMLAAAATLAMAHDAARLSGLSGAIILRNVRWLRPIRPAEAGVDITVEPSGPGLRFAVGPADGEVGCTGEVLPAGSGAWPPPVHAGEDPRAATLLPVDEVYAAFRAFGLDHGEPYRVVRRLASDGTTIVAGLDVGTRRPHPVDPGLLDSAFQTVIGAQPESDENDIALPASLGSLIVGPDGLGKCLAVTARDGQGTIDMTLCDPDGAVRAVLHDFAIGPGGRPGRPVECALARREWVAAPAGDLPSSAPEVLVLGAHGWGHLGAPKPLGDEELRRALAGEALSLGLDAEISAADAYAGLADLLRQLAARETPAPVTVTIVAPEAMAYAAAALGASVSLEHPLVRVRTRLPGPVPVGAVPAAPALHRVVDGCLERLGLATLDGPGTCPEWAPRPGTYVVTGGVGHIGAAIAAEIVRLGGHVSLLSRSADRSERVAGIGPADLVAAYAVDVASPGQLGVVIDRVRAEHGPIRGVVHAAGIESSRSFLAGDGDDAQGLLAVKIEGAELLDQLTVADDLDFFVTCSSLVGLTGNPGQATYAFANGWLIGQADERARRVQSGRCSGASVAIAWGPWAGGGMAAGVDVRHGLTPIAPDMGVRAWRRSLQAGETCVVVLAGSADLPVVQGALEPATAVSPVHATPTAPDAAPAAGPVEWAGSSDDRLDELVTILCEELKLPRRQVVPQARLESLGIESIMVAGITARLLQHYERVPKTLFFECRTVGDLVDALGGLTRRAPAASVAPASAASSASDGPSVSAGTASRSPARGWTGSDDALAIIGLAGRYPQARDLGEFWRNLRAGRDCVTQIPDGRWPLEPFFDATPRPGHSYSKWGGFLDDIDRFDPTFFRIAPAEAAMLDPQERLFLQEAWHAVEDAGYIPGDLPDRTGVWVGVMYGEHQLLGAASDGRLASASYASIANRVSYALDLRGPSMAVDSMCSSSLTALHLAWQSLLLQEADAAIVGGVNLSLHPHKYLQLSLTGFASSDGRCRSFGAGGDGYVPGEGVGAMVLKPLAAALRDGDPIRAVLRGSAVNHGGRTNGYTVPDPTAQADTIGRALGRAEISGRDLSYVEAHGTGTALGDPIELRGLAQHLGPDLAVPIGSVKSNVGHLESAAGMAALTKVVLQLEHEEIVPSLHADPLNPDMDLASAGVMVATTSTPWKRAGGRRVALVSSFGAGGSNASVVVEEPPVPDTADPVTSGGGRATAATPEVLVLSADSAELLRESGERLADWLHHAVSSNETLADEVVTVVAAAAGLDADEVRAGADGADIELDLVARARVEDLVSRTIGTRFQLEGDVRTLDDVLRAARRAAGHVEDAPRPHLADIAHTLRVGRVSRDERLAIVATDTDEAEVRLRAWLAGTPTEYAVAGRVRADAPDVPDAMEPLARASAWVMGAAVDFKENPNAHRIGRLPGRPFRRDRVWLDDARPIDANGVRCPETAAEVTGVGGADTVPGRSTPTVTRVPRTTTPLADELERLVTALTERAAARIGLPADRLDPARALGDYGYESLTIKDLAAEIEEEFGVPLDSSLFYDLRGVRELAEWMLGEHGETVRLWLSRGSTPASAVAPDASPALAPNPADTRIPPPPPFTASAPVAQSAVVTRAVSVTEPATGNTVAEGAIAIVGLSGRFPGSPDIPTFWKRLRRIDSLIEETPKRRWDWRSFTDKPDNPFRWGGYLDDEDCFDAAFFGITDDEARFMDPQQRLLLQESWAALEDAGYAPGSLAGSDTGIFAGVQFRDYQHLLHEAAVAHPAAATGNEDTFAVNRISYLLDLHGPSEVVNTACSSSLVAVHRAVRSLRSGECNLALAGGVALNLTPYAVQALEGLGVLSPHGTSHPLEARADGYVKGEGVAMVVLKPLAAALRDGDDIRAVIRGSATNHGGRATTITSPNSRAQSALIVSAVEDADVPVDSLSYIEMHGTGTYVGDPVEVRALGRAFRELAERQGIQPAPGSCGLGSGKTNYGHLEPASGIAGLVKLVGSLSARELVGMPDFEEVNPMIGLDGTPFRVIARNEPWASAAGVLRAGVSSFGIGGVNAHVVVEEAPTRMVTEDGPGPWLFPLSARSSQALTEVVRRLRTRVAAASSRLSATEVSATLVHGRDAMGVRCAVVADGLDDLLDALTELVAGDAAGRVVPACRAGEARDRLVAIAQDWVRGEGSLHHLPTGPRVSLPTYPFAATPYWFTERRPVGAAPSVAFPSAAPEPGPTSPAPTSPAPAQGGGLGRVGDGVREIVAEVLGCAVDAVGEEASFRNLGVDSLMSIRVVEALQARYDEQLPYSALSDYPTVRALTAALDRTVAHTSGGGETSAPSAPTAGPAPLQDLALEVTALAASPVSRPRGSGRPTALIPMQTGGDGHPSFWIPGAVGFAAAFTPLSQRLGDRYPFHAFHARGADDRSMPQLWDDMVEDYAAAIIRVQPEGPYVIGGHSFGGLTAISVARRLQAEGCEVGQLVMVDTFPPTQEVFDRHRGDYNDAFIIFYLANVLVDAENHPERTIREEDLVGVPKELHIPTLTRLVHERSAGAGRIEDIYHYLRGGLSMSEHSAGLYQVAELAPYNASPVLFIRALDGFVGRSSAVYWPRVDMMKGYDYVQPWREVISTPLDLIEIDEDHLHIIDGTAADMVAAAVRERLDRVASSAVERTVR